MARLRFYTLLVALVLWSGAAWADCILIGTLVRVDLLDQGRKNVHAIYLREFNTDPHYYVFNTPNLVLAGAAAILAALHTRVEVTGDESSCPASGQKRLAGGVRQLTAGP